MAAAEHGEVEPVIPPTVAPGRGRKRQAAQDTEDLRKDMMNEHEDDNESDISK